MNSLQRVKCALRREQPDRVPIGEFVIDEKVARAILPDVKDVPDFMDRMDLDTVACSMFFKKEQEFSDGSYTDEWGVTYKPSPEAVAHPVKGPITTMEDAETFTPPDPDAEHRLGMLPEVVARYKGKRAILFHARASFMWSAYLMGIDNLLASFLAEPELATLIMDKVLEANIRVVRRAVRAGAEIVVLGDDYAHNLAPLMSPNVFRELLLPRLAKMVAAIKEEGAFCVKHSDGNLYPIMDMIISTGIDGLNPIEPVAGMDLTTVKRLVGDKVCLLGNIDCGQLLSHGTPEQVENAVVQAIQDAGKGGGYIITSSNSIHSSVNPANYVAMIQAAKRHGEYS